MMTKIFTTLILAGLVLTGCFNNNHPPAGGTNSNNQNVNQNQEVKKDESASTTEVIISDVDTSEWKTYRNEEYGFAFKYPEEWKVYYEDLKKGRVNMHTYEDDLEIAHMSITIRDNDVEKDLFGWIRNDLCYKAYYQRLFCKRDPIIYKLSNIDLMGANKDNFLEVKNSDGWGTNVFLFKIKNTIFEVSYMNADGDGKVRSDEQFLKAAQEGKEILKTIKYIDEESVGEIHISTFGKYRNENYGFEFESDLGWVIFLQKIITAFDESGRPVLRPVIRVADENDNSLVTIYPEGGFDRGLPFDIQETQEVFGGKDVEIYYSPSIKSKLISMSEDENYNKFFRIEFSLLNKNEKYLEDINKLLNSFIFLN